MVPSAPGWAIVSLITVGDSAEQTPYRLVGMPDGLGARSGRYEGKLFVPDPRYLTVFMNHELQPARGVVRDHGQTGSFVSQWTIHLASLRVLRGEDLIQSVFAWDPVTATHVDATGAVGFGRLCSAELPSASAFYYPRTGRGFRGRIFMDGEEQGVEGRAFGHVASGAEKGNSYQLPHLGRFPRENSVTHANTGDRTIVVGSEDNDIPGGSLYLYMGQKRFTGNAVEKAGLVGGSLFGIMVTNGGPNYSGGAVTLEDNGPINGAFTLAEVSAHADLATGAGAALQADSEAAGVTQFARPEDVSWDPTNRNVLYFVTTGMTDAHGVWQWARLYRLRFLSIDHPQAGGVIDMIVQADTLPRVNGNGLAPPATGVPLFDNLTVDGRGHVIVQEDPSSDPYLAKIWDINPVTRTAVEIFEADPARFSPGGLTTDEEGSGVIEVTDLVRHAWWFERGRRYYLGDMQVGTVNPDPELVAAGQLYLFASPRHSER
jgi:hypothetical protein